MNTGICKRAIIGLTALSVLSACQDGATLNLLQQTETVPTVKPSPSVPLIQAQMVGGSVTLVPPSGFCIDPSSLTQNFALMARCDLLNGKNGALDAPIGVITTSIAKNSGQTLKATGVALASNSNVLETVGTGDLEIVRASTDTPLAGLAKTHYRAATQIDGYDLSLALFSPTSSEAQGSRGISMLQNLVRATHDASVATNVSAKTTANDSNPKKGFRATFANLFD